MNKYSTAWCWLFHPGGVFGRRRTDGAAISVCRSEYTHQSEESALKNNFVWLWLAMLTLLAGGAAAAEVDGRWAAQVPGFQGETIEITFTFKAEGTKLTGTIGSPMGERPISEGKIGGEDLSFILVFGSPDGEFKMKIVYKGKLSGDTIKMTQSFEGGPGDMPPIEFVAKRVK